MKRLFTIATIFILIFSLSGCSNLDTFDGNTDSSLQLYPAMIEIPIGGSLKLQPILESEALESAEVEWKSSDNAIVSVSSDGKINAKAEGDAVIEALLTNDKAQKDTCRVIVVSEGPTLLYEKEEPVGLGVPGGESESPETPPETPDESKDSPEQEVPADDNVPVEHDPELDIPVEHDPSIDEYTWTIRVNDTITKEIKDAETPMKIIYKLNLEAVKAGGKTSMGNYQGTATLEIKVDTSETEKMLKEKTEGKILKFLLDISATTVNNDLSMEVMPYNFNELFDFGRGPMNNAENVNPDPNGPEIVPLTPVEKRPEIAALVPQFGMAYGYTLFEGQGGFNVSTLDTAGIGINANKQMNSSEALTYKLSIGSGGKVLFELMELKTNEYFSGKLSKMPNYPK